MLRSIAFSTALLAALFVTSVASAQSGTRGAIPSAPAFSAPIQSAPVVGGSGTSFGARQTFAQPAPVISQPGPGFNGSGTVIRSAPSSSVVNQPIYSQPQTVYSQPQGIPSSCGCSSSGPIIQSAPVTYSAPIIRSAPAVRYYPPIRRSCGFGGY